MMQEGAFRASSKRLAKEARKQQKRESKRAGFSSFLGGGFGTLLGTALAGMTGGLAAPLLMAAGKFGGKIAAHELTKGMGADTGKLVAGKYGYGGEEAKTLKEGLEEQLRASDPTKQRGAFGGELMSAYTGAALSGGLGDAKGFLKGGEGAPSFGEALFGGKDTVRSFAGAKEALLGLVPGKSDVAEKVYSPLHDPTTPESIIGGEGYVGFPFEQESDAGLGPLFGSDDLEEVSPISVPTFNQGGLVQGKAPSIVEYFSMQGKTLGGSNTQSLSQMLGR